MTRTVEFVIDVWPCGNNPRVWMRRFLRRLVREAVRERNRDLFEAQTVDQFATSADRIARKLVP